MKACQDRPYASAGSSLPRWALAVRTGTGAAYLVASLVSGLRLVTEGHARYSRMTELGLGQDALGLLAPVVTMAVASLFAAALGVWLLARRPAPLQGGVAPKPQWCSWVVPACVVGGLYALGAAWFDYTRHVIAAAVISHGGEVVVNGATALPGPAMEGWYRNLAAHTLIRFALGGVVCPCLLAVMERHLGGRRVRA